MFIRPIARNTATSTYACTSENPHCLSAQRESNNNNNNTDTSSAAASTTPTPTPHLTHRNLVGVLVIAALLALGLILWLCFGRWSKPIRHFLRGESRCRRRRSDNNGSNNRAVARFGIGDGLAAPPIDCSATIAPSKAPEPRAASHDAEKAGMVDSSSSSTQSSLANRGAVEIDKDNKEMTQAGLEPALPAKVLHTFTIRSGSQLARLGQ